MNFRRLNSPIVLAVAIFFALVVNTIVHYTSPVYRYYENNVKRVNDQYSDLRKRLLTELVPFVQFSLTNRHDTSLNASLFSSLLSYIYTISSLSASSLLFVK